MDTKHTPPPVDLEALFDAVVRVAVREDMARIYGEEPREERQKEARELTPIFSRRQAE